MALPQRSLVDAGSCIPLCLRRLESARPATDRNTDNLTCKARPEHPRTRRTTKGHSGHKCFLTSTETSQHIAAGNPVAPPIARAGACGSWGVQRVAAVVSLRPLGRRGSEHSCSQCHNRSPTSKRNAWHWSPLAVHCRRGDCAGGVTRNNAHGRAGNETNETNRRDRSPTLLDPTSCVARRSTCEPLARMVGSMQSLRRPRILAQGASSCMGPRRIARSQHQDKRPVVGDRG